MGSTEDVEKRLQRARAKAGTRASDMQNRIVDLNRRLAEMRKQIEHLEDDLKHAVLDKISDKAACKTFTDAINMVSSIAAGATGRT